MKKKPEPKPIVPAHIQEMPITETLEQNYMPYAISVIVSRAIPEIDGFKPSHRKLLYTMYLMGLLRGDRTKSSNVVGQTMRLNPHGDAAIYETMVRLTTGNGALLLPFVDSKGNFGKVYSRLMAYAAPRYTEVKLAPVCQELFGDIDKNTVTFVDNFDGTMQEPLLLPVSFPNILVNPNQGIAVGMASNFCSFNLREVCDTTIRYIKNPDCDLLESLLGLYLPNLLGLSEGERILYVTATKDFAGYMFFVFQNGKAVKVPLGAYATKSNRKKLVNAYSDKALLAYLAHIPEDSDFLLLRDADKATLMNTALLSESVSKNAGGIQAYTLKKNSKVSRVIPKDEFLSNNVEYYRTQKLPTTGHFLQEADKQKNGISPQIALPGMEK